MNNETLLKSFLSDIPHWSWQHKCIVALNDSSDFDWTQGLVGRAGRPVSDLSSAWGVNITDCFRYCNNRVILGTFNFQLFSSCMTNYLLPWIALTAQLPYETGDFRNNIMSGCLAVGSPALATYSLTLTIFNRCWVSEKFKDLHNKARSLDVQERFDGHDVYDHRIRAAAILLQEAQQVPLRASQEQGWLSSLIVIPRNSKWWKDLEGRLKSTRRGVTLSLFSQMTFAFVAYLFTVISSFEASLGDPITALQIASGSLWNWLIPVIAGWIVVGTQNTDDSIRQALGAKRASHALKQSIQSGQISSYTELAEQRGLSVRSDNTFGSGDAQRKGPIYNYAKLFTWWQVASSIERALDETLNKVIRGQACRKLHHEEYNEPVWNPDILPEGNLTGDADDTAHYCGLETSLCDYPKWKEIPAELWERMVWASAVALFLQWGTTGASLLIAYLTPTVGLGCRSAAYLLYGALATFAWLCLVISSLLSHAVMLRYQDSGGQHEKSGAPAMLCFAAESLRLFGNSLAFLNAMWLIASSLMEFTGGFDNCWCNADVFGLHKGGWVVLFKGANSLASAASLPWGSGLAMSILVCTVCVIIFFLGSWSKDD